ncbi:MAG: nickel pincer cofactor biosynthesis protein LarC [Anaerovibrio sp.]
MSRILYIDAPFGISGDMMAAALLDLGASYEKVQEALASLPVGGFSTENSRVKKAGLDMCDFLVKLDEAHENHDHDMAYLHGNGIEHTHEHIHEHHHHEHEHDHAHEHCHHDHDHIHHHAPGHEHNHAHTHTHHHEPHHHHEHRGMPEIREVLAASSLSPAARACALKIFDVLAAAEAKAHGTDIDKVHFHEVGAVDSIVDIVTIAVCLEDLQLDGVVVGSLTDGCGTIRCQHGIMAVPVPAVTNIAVQNHLRLKLSSIEGELVTPTGAAVAAAIRTSDRLPDAYRIIASGMGAGKREYSVPSFLRLLLLETEDGGSNGAGNNISSNISNDISDISNGASDGQEDTVVGMETNIDDSSGEALGLVMERLMSAGALDTWFSPIYMKKNRPAYMLGVICRPEDADVMERLIFRHTSSIGIRSRLFRRHIMAREIRELSLDGITVKVKLCRYGDIEKCYPEYESIRLLQEKKGLDYLSAYEMIRMSAMKQKNML